MAILPVSASHQQPHEDAVDIEYDSEAEEELRLDCEEKQNELVELGAEVRAARLEAQQLRLRLQAVLKSGGGGKASQACNIMMPDASTQPAPVVEDPRVTEFRPFVSWLAQNTDLTASQVFDVGLEVAVGGQATLLGRVAQWPVSGGTPQLWLSVPEAHQEAMYSLLQSVRHGATNEEELRVFASVWSLVPGELAAQNFGNPQKAVLLASREDVSTATEPPSAHVGFGALVAPWPTPQALQMFRAVNATEGHLCRSEDRVEVQYEGNYYAGTVHSVDSLGRASVRCDVDEPGVFTIAPLCRLRPLNLSSRSTSSWHRLPSRVMYNVATASLDVAASPPAQAVAGEFSRAVPAAVTAQTGARAAQFAAACTASTHASACRPFRHRRSRSAM